MKNIKATLALLSVALPSSFLCAQECLIIGHRGASYDAPENTLASVNLAWEQGVRAAEIDIHLSSDDQIVVLHDFNTKKLYGRDREVKDQTYAELRELDAGIHKGEQWAGEQIPLLDEVLATVPAGRILVIEIKVGPEIIPELEKSLARSGLGPDQIIMISFNWESTAAAKQTFSDHRVYALSSFKKDKETPVSGPDRRGSHREGEGSRSGRIERQSGRNCRRGLHRKGQGTGLEAYVWTVDDPVLAMDLKHAVSMASPPIARNGWPKNSKSDLTPLKTGLRKEISMP